MRVHATKDTCAVASLCVYQVPEVFSQDEEGQVEVLDAAPPEALLDRLRTAARACPTKSIHIETHSETHLGAQAATAPE